MFQILSGLIEEVVSRVYDGEPMFSQSSKKGKGRVVVEEEVLLCKNNVCVHVQSSDVYQVEQHQPGYFTMKYVYRDSPTPDAILCWVPNSLLAAGLTEEDTNAAAIACESCLEPLDEETVLGKESSNTGAGQSNIHTPSAPGDLHTPDFEKDSAPSTSCPQNPIAENLVAGAINTRAAVSMSCPASPGELPLTPSKRCESFDTPLGDVFCVNLQEMKALKLFFTNPECSSGQFVIGNHENQYKVFHFHHNGMDKLSEIFDDWNGCTFNEHDNADPSETHQKIYLVKRQEEMKSPGKNRKSEVHENFAEEGKYQPMNLSTWRSYLNPLGQIEDVNNFRKHVFFGGLSQEVRVDAWKFLLYCYPVQSTSFERDGPLKREKEDAYKALDNKRLALTGEDYEKFWKEVQFTVDKDVVRTDRSNPFYAGQDNPNLQKMRNILLNYAVYNPTMGYTQGMSDLVAPLLSVMVDEVETFWSFVGLMEFSMFATTPTDNSMEKSLGFLKELLRLMYPDFYIHCLLQDEDLSLLFCHRWLVLCFKREFIEPETLTVWEACWSRYLTDYFHIFIAVAILCIYGKKCIDKKMGLDKMLEYFSDLAMKFDGSAILKKARSILFKFRRLQVIPCTLEGLLSGPGIWDGGIAPEIECISHNRRCCFDKKGMIHVESVLEGVEMTVDVQSDMQVGDSGEETEIKPDLLPDVNESSHIEVGDKPNDEKEEEEGKSDQEVCNAETSLERKSSIDSGGGSSQGEKKQGV